MSAAGTGDREDPSPALSPARGASSRNGPADDRPACLITGELSDYRREPFRLLAEQEDVEVIAFADPGAPVEGLVVHSTTQAGAVRLAGSGRFRAVICGLGGRLALPGSYLAARRARVPFVLWASIWAHPRTPAHALSYPLTRYLYRHADAVVTYGRHVSAYVSARRGRGDDVFEAAQAVSAERFGAPFDAGAVEDARRRAGVDSGSFMALFVGRLEHEKGLEVLLEAWSRAELPDGSVLAVVGAGPLRARVEAAARDSAGSGRAVHGLGQVDRRELPALYAAADVLVLPSIRTATFVEPWGLVLNEAMHQGTPTIASDAVGAVAGGLVRDGHNGLVTPQGSVPELADRLSRMATDSMLRSRLGSKARTDVGSFSEAAWVEGMRRALVNVGAGRKS